MKKIIRLTESDLVKLVKRVIKETSEPGFSDWLEENSNIRNLGGFCIQVQNSLDKNGYRNNYDAAPKEFKQLVQETRCFYSSMGKQNDKVKEVMKTRNISDMNTKKLLNWLVKNDF